MKQVNLTPLSRKFTLTQYDIDILNGIKKRMGLKSLSSAVAYCVRLENINENYHEE